MQFNSWSYFSFLFLIFALYYFGNNRQQKILLLAASYAFYSVWDWRLTSLLALLTAVVYVCGHNISQSGSRSVQRRWLWLCLAITLGILALFKYYNFFIENLQLMAGGLGLHIDGFVAHIVVPVGLSFYTFQALTYPLDIYRGQLQPRKPLDVALFVSFFPQLAAGPIERAKNIFPQLEARRAFNASEFEKGCWLLFWGLFKKVFVADNLAVLVNASFDHTATITAPTLYLSVIAYAFQIYCDFSSYTDMARGSAKLFGLQLIENFNFPYVSTNPREFWRRWHISLSSWLRDYIYIPLGGSRGGPGLTYRNILFTMTLCGLWHGAAWNFFLWGVYQGLLLILYDWHSSRFVVRWGNVVSTIVMFHFTLFGWLLFRANRVEVLDGMPRDESLQQIAEVLGSVIRGMPLDAGFWQLLGNSMFFIIPLLAVEALMISAQTKYLFQKLPPYQTVPIRAALLFLIVVYGVQAGERFIYFQF
jgi:D-alanyl-lipoteichoic acid acyltransferase DltB (MBOAT superfamily)